MESPPARLLRHARREALIALALWAVLLVWTLGYCHVRGYRDSPAATGAADLKLILGVPEWAFFGIAVPWLLATVFTIAFALWIMTDDDLGEARQDGER